jgi:hypothetical protein
MTKRYSYRISLGFAISGVTRWGLEVTQPSTKFKTAVGVDVSLL